MPRGMRYMKLAYPVAILLSLMFVLPSAFSAAPQQTKQKEWTVIIYLDADNNLEGAGVHDMNELETVGSTDDVNIVVLMDRSQGQDTTNGDWTGAKKYYITKDNDLSTIGSKELADLGEVNMGDPETFINFTTWAVDNYPAKNYLVDFWDHGGGWHGVCWDDDNKGDNLNLANITYGLDMLKRHIGRNIDLVGFDACLMAGVEILYSIKDSCDVGLTSGTTEPNDGWPYDWIMPALAMKPTMTPKELAKEITEDYVNSYTDGKDDPQDTPTATMSSWDMKMVPQIFDQFNQLSMRLALRAFTWNAYLREVRANTQGYDPGHVKVIDVLNYPLYDMYDMCKELLKPFGGPIVGFLIDNSVKQNIDYLMKDIMGARVSERHGPQFPDAYGLTMYWPSGDNQVLLGTPKTQYDARYDNILFSKEQYWDDFLKAYTSMTNAANTPPYANIGSPVANATLDANDGSVLVQGTAFDASSLVSVEVRIDGGNWKKVSGLANWEYKWNLQSLKGRHTISVKASDGIEDSPITSREYDIKPATTIAGQNPTVVYAGVGVIVILLLVGIVGFVWMRRKGMGLRDLLAKLKPAKSAETESD